MCKEDQIKLLPFHDVLQSASCRELTENVVGASRASTTPEPCYSPSTTPAHGQESPSGAAFTAIFFARVPPMVPYKDLHTLFSRFGAVQDLNLFRRWAAAKTSKGCGIVQYSTAEEATRALQALHGVHTFEGFPGCEGPMVVEWMDPSKLNTSNDSTTGSKASKPVKERPSASKIPGRLWGRAGKSSNSINSQKGCQQQQLQLSQQLPIVRAGAAAAAHSALGCEHPAVEALADISNLLPCFSDAWSVPLAAAALAEPSCNWTSNIPVHLLPVLCNQARANIECFSLPQLHGMVPPAAVDAVAAAAQAANPARLGQLPTVASSASASALCFPAASGLDPWPAAALPSNTDSCSLSFTSQCTGFVPMTNPQLVAAQQLQQQQRPLLLLDDAWASDSCGDFTSADVSFEASSKGGAAGLTSEGLSLIDSSMLLCRLGEAAGATTASASCQHCPSSLFDSSSSKQAAGVSGLLPRASGTGELFEPLSDRVNSNLLSNNMAPAAAAVPNHVEHGCYATMQPCTSSGLVSSDADLSMAAAPAPEVAAGNQQQAVNLPLCDSAFCQLAPHINRVAKATGAELQITAGVSGMQLCMQGSATQLDAACGLLRMVLSAAGTA